MRLEGFIKETSSAMEKYSLSLVIIAKTDNAVKIKAQVSENIYLQFYYNQKSKTRNYVLVGWSRRLYGRDSVGGEWHKHPSEKPEEHDFSEEGRKETSPGEFIREAFEGSGAFPSGADFVAITFVYYLHHSRIRIKLALFSIAKISRSWRGFSHIAMGRSSSCWRPAFP